MLCGWEPKIVLEEGLDRTATYFKKKPSESAV